MYQSSLDSVCTELSLPLLQRFPFMHIHEDMALANHVTTFSRNMLENFFFPQVAYFFGLNSFVRGTFTCEGMHILCRLESIEEKCFEQDKASSRTATGLIMQKIVATETSVLQATGWSGHWYVRDLTGGFCCCCWEFLRGSYVLANCTK